MNGLSIYRITQDEESWYDTYDSAVVVAKSSKDAAKIHPGGYGSPLSKEKHCTTWASTPDNVVVEKIGAASSNMLEGEVIVASFNAG